MIWLYVAPYLSMLVSFHLEVTYASHASRYPCLVRRSRFPYAHGCYGVKRVPANRRRRKPPHAFHTSSNHRQCANQCGAGRSELSPGVEPTHQHACQFATGAAYVCAKTVGRSGSTVPACPGAGRYIKRPGCHQRGKRQLCVQRKCRNQARRQCIVADAWQPQGR